MNETELLKLRVRRLEEIVARFFTGKFSPAELENLLDRLVDDESLLPTS